MRRAVIDGQDRLLVVVRDIEERKQTDRRERQTSAGLRAAIEAAQELMDCADLDMLYRRSVELAREKMGLERCGLYLLDDQSNSICWARMAPTIRARQRMSVTARDPVAEAS